MNSHQAKKIPLVQILAQLGHHPVRKDKGGVEWVYNSPFRNEKIPSMFVNVQKNIWNDFGCLLYTSPSPRDATLSRMPSSA